MILSTRESRVKIPRRGNDTTTPKNPHGVWVVNRWVNLDSFTVAACGGSPVTLTQLITEPPPSSFPTLMSTPIRVVEPRSLPVAAAARAER